MHKHFITRGDILYELEQIDIFTSTHVSIECPTVLKNDAWYHFKSVKNTIYESFHFVDARKHRIFAFQKYAEVAKLADAPS